MLLKTTPRFFFHYAMFLHPKEDSSRIKKLKPSFRFIDDAMSLKILDSVIICISTIQMRLM